MQLLIYSINQSPKKTASKTVTGHKSCYSFDNNKKNYIYLFLWAHFSSTFMQSWFIHFSQMKNFHQKFNRKSYSNSIMARTKKKQPKMYEQNCVKCNCAVQSNAPIPNQINFTEKIHSNKPIYSVGSFFRSVSWRFYFYILLRYVFVEIEEKCDNIRNNHCCRRWNTIHKFDSWQCDENATITVAENWAQHVNNRRK